MKSGSSNDPFSDIDEESTDDQGPEATDEDDIDGVTDLSDTDSEAHSGAAPGTSRGAAPRSVDTGPDTEYPYKLRRNSVKDERSMVQLYVQDSTERRSSARKADFEEKHGVDVYLTDWREAAYLAGLEGRTIADVLREWGYEL